MESEFKPDPMERFVHRIQYKDGIICLAPFFALSDASRNVDTGIPWWKIWVKENRERVWDFWTGWRAYELNYEVRLNSGKAWHEGWVAARDWWAPRQYIRKQHVAVAR